MTRQQKIREQMAKWLYWHEVEIFGILQPLKWEDLPQIIKDGYYGVANGFLSKLHSQGAVLRVERELPEPQVKVRGNYNVGYYTCRLDMLKAGYVAVEPLVDISEIARW